MRYSKILIPTLKEVPAEATLASHKLMLRAGMIRKVASGIYSYLPLGWRVLQKVSNIIREEMLSVDAHEMMMPMVQPKELWEESGRWGEMEGQMVAFKDGNGREFCLGPTHEEVITDVLRAGVKSYKDLPLSLYQIQTKFRDEIRPRFGLMRAREFIMKDAYSFCVDTASSELAYEKMFEAYHRIFSRCGLHFVAVDAATGTIGGNKSHEFQVLANSGEDHIATCEDCGYAANVELAFEEAFDESKAEEYRCPKCQGKVTYRRGIEVGHIFNLGTKYSKSMGATVLGSEGKPLPLEMGCYGIGVGRTVAAAIEQCHDENGIIWPPSIAPFHVSVVSIGSEEIVVSAVEHFEASAEMAGLEVLVDDRNERPGVKFKDADLIGCPFRVVFGKKGLSEGKVELYNRRTDSKELMPVETVVAFLAENCIN